MKPWIIVLIVLAVIAVILGLLYYFGKKAQTKQAAQQEQMEAMKQTVSMLIIDKKKLPTICGLSNISFGLDRKSTRLNSSHIL